MYKTFIFLNNTYKILKPSTGREQPYIIYDKCK